MSVRHCPERVQYCMLDLLGQLVWALAYLIFLGFLGYHGVTCIICAFCISGEMCFAPQLAECLVCFG